jgi:carboxymethylenebutenolidase
MRELSDPQVLEDIQAAVDLLSRHAGVAGKPVGVSGFCMGGSYALLAASSLRGISACVAFYGLLSHEHGLLSAPDLDRAKHPRDPLRALPDLACPTLAIFGDQDEFVPMDDVRALERGLEAAKQPSQVVVYPGCGHAFLNEARPAAWRPDEARAAWRRMLDWFRTHLAA